MYYLHNMFATFVFFLKEHPFTLYLFEISFILAQMDVYYFCSSGSLLIRTDEKYFSSLDHSSGLFLFYHHQFLLCESY